MGRSQETTGKKEVRNRKEKKRKEKAEKKAKRKTEGKKSSFDDMIAYVDEFGKITSSPPDPEKKVSIPSDSIELNYKRNKTETDVRSREKRGVVITFNSSKGYGFIRELDSPRSIFVHANNLLDPVSENDKVTFEIGKGNKGPVALNVRLLKE